MEQNQQKPAEEATQTEGGSLEGSDVSAQDAEKIAAAAAAAKAAAKPKGSLPVRLLRKVNVYLLLFILVLFLLGAVFFVAVLSNKSGKPNNVKTQSLSGSTLKQIASSDVTVGQPKQVLNVQSNAVFAGKVLIQDSLEVAGTIQVGGILNVPGITVAGTSQLSQVAVSQTLSVGGDTSLQGQLAIQKSLSVSGGATFGGAITAPQISVNTIQLNGDLNLTHHITAGGATPTRAPGSALGSGGSASISGSDTAGSININTGSGAAAGCFITVTFAQKFNATPHVIATPIGAAAGTTGFYVNRTVTGFSVCAANTPQSNASFGFDYFVLD